MQTQWSSQMNPIIQLPINQGILLKSIFLVSGSNTIPHKLQRNLQGWFLTRIRGSSTIYDHQDNNLYPSLTLILMSSADVVIDLFVF